MPVSGLVVNLADPESALRVSEQMARAEAFTLGEQIGLRLPVVLHAGDAVTADAYHAWLQQLPGVVNVDVAFIYLDDPEESARVS
jgi:hypothetical protein